MDCERDAMHAISSRIIPLSLLHLCGAMLIHVKSLTGNIITLDVKPDSAIIEDVLDMVQAQDVVMQQQAFAINVLSTGVVYGGLRLVCQDTGLEYYSDEWVGHTLQDGSNYKVVLKKLFNDGLQAEDMVIVTMLQDQYRADLNNITHDVFSNSTSQSMRYVVEFIHQITCAKKMETRIMSSLYIFPKKSCIKTSTD